MKCIGEKTEMLLLRALLITIFTIVCSAMLIFYEWYAGIITLAVMAIPTIYLWYLYFNCPNEILFLDSKNQKLIIKYIKEEKIINIEDIDSCRNGIHLKGNVGATLVINMKDGSTISVYFLDSYDSVKELKQEISKNTQSNQNIKEMD